MNQPQIPNAFYIFSKRRMFLLLCLSTASFVLSSLMHGIDTKDTVYQTPGVLRVDREVINSSIFFLETSGLECLTRRQVCSVESTARANPDLAVRVIFVRNIPKPEWVESDEPSSGNASKYRDCSTTATLLNLNNVAFHNLSFTELVKDTLLEKLHLNGAFNTSVFPTYHLSDGLRIILLKKYGGWYLDLDCVVFRSIANIRNAVGMKDSQWLENGVIAFDVGHPFLSFYEKSFVSNFDNQDYGVNGPQLLTSTLMNYCKTSGFFAATYDCKDAAITVRPSQDFYAIQYDFRDWFFSEIFPRNADKLMKQNYLLHIYENEEGISKAPPETLYAILASEFCPVAYERSIKVNRYF